MNAAGAANWILGMLFPRDIARTARRAGIVAVTLGVTVAILFPRTLAGGTANLTDRIITAGVLAAAGILLVRSRGHMVLVVVAGVLLLGAALFTGAAWLVAFAAIACLYTATALRPHHAAEWAREMSVRTDDVRDMVEALGTALVLALVVREFGLEAFKIPTGSMEPTIMGDHQPFRFFGWNNGDRLLAFKPMPLFRGPGRWEIWVFKWPLYRPTNYIKRIVGVSGERFAIRGGDVYVGAHGSDDLRLVSKPDTVQEAMWNPRLDTSGTVGVSDVFSAPGSTWKLDARTASVDAPAGDADWARCSQGFEKDFKMSFDVADAAWRTGGVLSLKLRNELGEVVLDVRADGASVTAPGADGGKPERREIALSGDSLGRSFRIGLAASDRIVRVYVDGRQRVKLSYADIQQPLNRNEGRFEVGAAGFAGRLSSFLGENDVQYIAGGESPAGYDTRSVWDIPEGSYLALGDNARNSSDSRMWTTNLVRLKDGREFTAPSSARIHDEDHTEMNFREDPDGSAVFYDSYGVPRSFKGDEIAEIKNSEPAPYVRSSDMVGPAFLIFWEVWPQFRPRIVR